MPFHIVRNDITNMAVDAIVNTANPKPIVGSGVDYAIHQKAGPMLLEARRKIGNIAVGNVAVTPAFQLPAKYVIHASGPVWQGGEKGEITALTACYDASLQFAAENNCKSIAFPLLSSGNYGFPKGVALQTGIAAISRFLMEHEMDVYLVVFDKKSYTLSEKLFSAVESYIDEKYVEEANVLEYASSAVLSDRCLAPRFEEPPMAYAPPTEERASSPSKRSLQDLLKEVDDSFSTHLFRLIDGRGLTDPQVYKKANIDRKLFSKIRTNENYKPSKATAIALAIALELNLDETKDLLRRAGYALTHSSVFDIIIEYFILHENYDIFEINAVLFEFEQPVIGV